MPSESWDEVITRYQEVYLHSRNADNAKGILNLIPRIRDNPTFVDVVPSTSLTALCLEILGKKGKVIIWWEKDREEYSVSVQDDSNSEEKWTKVNNEQIIPILQQHIQKISAE